MKLNERQTTTLSLSFSHSHRHTSTYTAQESATLATFVTTRRDATPVNIEKLFVLELLLLPLSLSTLTEHGGVFRVVCWKKVQSPQKRRRSCLRCLCCCCCLLALAAGSALPVWLVGLPLLLLDVGCDSCWNNNNNSVLRARLIGFLFTLTPSQQQFMPVCVCVFVCVWYSCSGVDLLCCCYCLCWFFLHLVRIFV